MRHTRVTLAALAATVALTASAAAGGFGRGTADTDILFEEGNFNMRAGVAIVSPTRTYTVNANPALVGTDFAGTYVIPSGAVKFSFTKNLSCAGTYTDAYGGTSAYAAPLLPLAKLSESFTVGELGVTCAAFFNAGKGRFSVLGGGFLEQFSYNLVAANGAVNIGLQSTAPGWRAGVAYEIPEIALRAQAIYRSGTTHAATGVANGFIPASGAGTLPQSFEVKVQSGVAPGWLAFGSVKWTDWSVNKTLTLTSAAIGGTRQNLYFWKDGWTVTAGVGHAFNDRVSGAASVTWDRGVSTGFDLMSDTWTFAAGTSLKDPFGGELRVGGAVSYLAAAAENQYGPLNSAVGRDWAIAGSASYKVKW
jgi:long-chain fatty acid transport protein